MPALSFFYGIKILMYWTDHPPPHFHAEYGEFEGVYAIATLLKIAGQMPRGAELLVLEWAREHQQELMEAWNLCSKQIPPSKIPPLP